MPGLVPGIHAFLDAKKDVDGRVKPGHDERGFIRRELGLFKPSGSASCHHFRPLNHSQPFGGLADQLQRRLVSMAFSAFFIACLLGLS